MESHSGRTTEVEDDGPGGGTEGEAELTGAGGIERLGGYRVVEEGGWEERGEAPRLVEADGGGVNVVAGPT